MKNLPLSNKTFVFTGNMEMDREEATYKVIELGGRCTKALSGKTTFLVAGDNPGQSKMAKAKKLKIEILNEVEFIKMISVDMDQEIDKNAKFHSSVEKIDISDFGESIGDSAEWGKEPSKTKDKNTIYSNVLGWAEKYRPRNSNEIIGNKGALEQIREFIGNKENKKCLFISGSPGLGKTTAVQVICKELNVELLEFNASDVRSKKTLVEQVKNKISTNSVLKGKRIVLMDEVDGMTSDRGGLAELNQIIKNSNVQFICIANDRQHLKLKTLINNSSEVKFKKLLVATILPRLKSILKSEGCFLPDTVLTEICMRCNQDIRYILNVLQRNKDIKNIKDLKVESKDISKNTFEIVAQLFKPLNCNKKLELFFEDYTILPLFMHEMYIKAHAFEWGKRKINEDVTIEKIHMASEALSFGDVIDGQIHGSAQNYSLLPAFGLFSCLIPGQIRLNSQIVFPQYLGKLSKITSIGKKIANMALSSKVNMEDFSIYFCVILQRLSFLLEQSLVMECVGLMLFYDIDKDMLYDMFKLFNIEIKNISSKTKSSLTKEYNKHKPVTSIKKEAKSINEDDFISD
ncbi:replication factor C subunit [Ecytonucleospora hepatopenaei]|uniref:Replication factor C subunit 1 n=1 Tax=Ecytonucleospora hepatopenaei TaxID=646526 RepID=A0A1W0E2K5_9MICR|nr:RFC1 [Ecytonucleospora hepatopenaei]OQS55230.1 replication factor C subunit [Ecytonucleospora hepatopenaei]